MHHTIARRVRDLSIRRKLILITTSTCAVAVTLATGIFIGLDIPTYRRTLEADLQTTAAMLAASSPAALAFADDTLAGDVLAGLSAKSAVVAGCTYKNTGTLLVAYERPGASAKCPPTLPAVSPASFVARQITASAPVIDKDQEWGTIYLVATQQPLRDRLRWYLFVGGLVIGVSCLVVVLISTPLQRTVAAPIVRLADTMRTVKAEQRYDIRAAKVHDDEVGTLIDGFNDMLSEVEHRDRELRRHREQLESDVAARTAELRQANADLMEAKNRAEDANSAKGEFLANMSHEIRTPMNVVLGMTELTLDTDLTAEQRECLTLAQSSATALLSILNDILDFSKIESRRLELESVPFNFRDLIADTVRPLAMRAHEKGLRTTIDISPEIPATVVGDPVRLRQVLANLVGNAIKFTSAGHVMVSIEPQSLGTDLAVLQFQVTDTGIGIPAEKQDLVFEPFRQADGSTTRHFGGTGLGLTISQQLVAMMGGALCLDSVAGLGSTFHFTASFGLGEMLPQVVSASVTGLSVLVADDNEASRRLIEKTLSRWRVRLTLVENGQQALDAFTAAEERGEPYTLMLLDGQMPGMDGYEVVRRMNAMGHARTTPIVMMTSGNEPGGGERARDMGVAVHLVKPVGPSDLLRAIGQMLGRLPDRGAAPVVEGAQAAAPAAPPALPAGGVRPARRILLAEDNPTNRLLVLRILERCGHQVTVAENGKEAVDALEAVEVDLVLMDLQMPVMGGFEATRAIRQREEGTGRHLPIIAMTAHAMNGDRERCIEAGMDEYVSKPVDSARLLALIDSVCGAGPAGAPAPAVPAPTASCDVNAFIDRLGGDVELARDMATLFIPDAMRLLEKIREAVGAANPERLRHEAHALKGAASNFNATQVVAASRDLESMARSGDLGRSPAVFAALEAHTNELLADLRAFGEARAFVP